MTDTDEPTVMPDDRAVRMPNGRIAMRCKGVGDDADSQPWLTTDPITYPDGQRGLLIRHLRDDQIPKDAIRLVPETTT